MEHPNTLQLSSYAVSLCALITCRIVEAEKRELILFGSAMLAASKSSRCVATNSVVIRHMTRSFANIEHPVVFKRAATLHSMSSKWETLSLQWKDHPITIDASVSLSSALLWDAIESFHYDE